MTQTPPKVLVVLCDGTGNSPEANIDGTVANNVQITRDLLGAGLEGKRRKFSDLSDGWEVDHYTQLDGKERRVFYLRGLGAPALNDAGEVLGWTWSPKDFFKNGQVVVQQFLGMNSLLVASGLINKVAFAYKFLVENYNPGDEVYMLGFSRGSYTLRVLITILRYSGLVDRSKFLNSNGEINQKDLKEAIEEAFSLYDRNQHPNNPDNPVVEFREKNSLPTERLVNFLGLWDTVPGPVKGTIREDGKVTNVVKRVRHALAIDDKRAPYKPEILTANEETELHQSWFPGSHCNVGGGYANRGLSNSALHWMLDGAMEAGLKIDEKSLKDPVYKPDPLAPQVDSYNSRIQNNSSRTYANLFTIYHRKVGQTVVGESISQAAQQRYGKKVINIQDDKEIEYVYLPSSLDRFGVIVENFKRMPNFTLNSFEMHRERSYSDDGTVGFAKETRSTDNDAVTAAHMKSKWCPCG